MATKFCRVGVKDDYVVRGPVRAHTVVFKRLARVEVEHEDDRTLLVDDELVFFVTQGKILVLSTHSA